MSIERFAMPDVLIAAEAEVGEGPVTDQRTGRLVWIDILEGLIHETALDTGDQRTTSLQTLIGAAAPRAVAEGFVVGVSDGLGYCVDGTLTVAEPILPEPHRRMNDAKCDSRGRLWAGSNHLEFEPGVGKLHRWDGASPSVIQAEGLTLPNGLGWSPADDTMYLVDSMSNRLLSAPYDADDGVVGDFSPLSLVEPGLPDGLSVDLDGNIWIAVWSGGEVRRFNSSGELTGIVPMPVSQPTSCSFSADGTLTITSARRGLTAEELAKQPHAGSVFALATQTRGVPVSPFAM
jgi:sugar lactone lactonase YvrE